MLGNPESISQGMQKANAQKAQWLQTLSSKETTFEYVVELSKTEEYKALAALRILNVLLAADGWSERSALEAMSHYGIGPKDTVKSIRRSRSKIESIDKLLASNPRMFRPRPEFPEGWPFMGKLSALYQSMPGVEVPDELLELMEEMGEELPAASSTDDTSLDELTMLMGGGHE